ncbi:PhzF family phenazine biosynthesis protein [Limobrevibacterium gyesilva]|uniref:PhzF family phenazine biosynthesis protein n=1 Tax=Limobrevibacterium gyesilva TaxID=2991712 RepID=A0AA41YP63_9PROT|nr:PhzF family phenazine biosynthesis protein [Limobrevibacterium gyesilva]MCW3474113.1 PhzF family phenazine biosynthesis protein [Limobrevibacterium gyesilva]
MRLSYAIVDAFADRVFRGNPAAVVPLEAFLPDAVMQAIAAENNLSETAFVVRDGEGYRLRWFTPTIEVELCGHATLATAFVLAERGDPAPFAFQTRSGVLTVTREDGRFVLDFPAWRVVSADPPPGIAAALGATPREVHRARDWICVFDDPATVAALRPNHALVAALPGERLIATAAGGTEPGIDVTSRYFAAKIGIPEDPVTGAAHVQLVPFWAERLGRTRLVCRQASARGGTLWCELAGDRVRLGGTAVAYARGEILLSPS